MKTAIIGIVFSTLILSFMLFGVTVVKAGLIGVDGNYCCLQTLYCVSFQHYL
jgi:hypothetical protein